MTIDIAQLQFQIDTSTPTRAISEMRNLQKAYREDQQRSISALEQMISKSERGMGLVSNAYDRAVGKAQRLRKELAEVYETFNKISYAKGPDNKFLASAATLNEMKRALTSYADNWTTAMTRIRQQLDPLTRAFGALKLQSPQGFVEEAQKIIQAYRTIASSANVSANDQIRAQIRMRAALKDLAASYKEVEQGSRLLNTAWGNLNISSASQFREQAGIIIQSYRNIANAGTSSASEIARANSAMRQSLKDLAGGYRAQTPQTPAQRDAAALSGAYSGLGILSSKQYEAEAAKIRGYYQTIAQASGSSSADIARAHKAMNDQLDVLKSKYEGVQKPAQTLFGTLSGGWQKLISAGGVVWALRQLWDIVAAIGRGFYEMAIKPVDEFKKTSIAVASAVTDSFSRIKASQADMSVGFSQNLVYAQKLTLELERAAAKYGVQQHDLQSAVMISSIKGLLPQGDIEVQAEKMAKVLAKIQMMTVGQNQSIQMAQELRALADGSARVSDQFARMMKDVMGPGWKQIIQDAIETGRLWEVLNEQLGGMNAGAARLENTFSSLWSRIATGARQVLVDAFSGLYDEIIKVMQPIAQLMEMWGKIAGKNVVERTALQEALSNGKEGVDYVRKPASATINGLITAGETGGIGYSPADQFELTTLGRSKFGGEKLTQFKLPQVMSEDDAYKGMHLSDSDGYEKRVKDQRERIEKLRRQRSRMVLANVEMDDMRKAGTIATRGEAFSSAQIAEVDAQIQALNDGLTDLEKKKNARLQKAADRFAAANDRIQALNEKLAAERDSAESAMYGDKVFAKFGMIDKEAAQREKEIRSTFRGLHQSPDEALAYSAETYDMRKLGVLRSARFAAEDAAISVSAKWAETDGDIELQTKMRNAKEILDTQKAMLQYEYQYKDAAQLVESLETQIAERRARGADESDRTLMLLEGQREEALQLLAALGTWIAVAPKQRDAMMALNDRNKQKAIYSDQAEYAKLMGNAQEYYALQVKMLMVERESNKTNAAKIQLIDAQIARAQNRASMNVTGLMDQGLADYAMKTYDELATKIETALPNAMDTFSDAFTQNFLDVVDGAKSVGDAFNDMSKTMRNAMMRTFVEIGVLIVRMQILRGLGFSTGQSMSGIGVNTAGGVTGNSSGTTSGGGGGGFNLNLGGGNNLLGGGWVESLNSWGYNTLGIGSGVPAGSAVPIAVTPAQEAMAAEMGGLNGLSSATSSGMTWGLGSMASGALSGVGVGSMLGNLIWPNGTANATSMIGGGIGGAIGSIFGPIGALVGGAIGGLGGSLFGNSTTQRSPTGQSGITVAMVSPFMPGQTQISGWSGMRAVTSGAFGSSSTSHYTVPIAADPALVKAWNTGMLSNYNSIGGNFAALGYSPTGLDNFTFPTAFNVDQANMDKYLYNMSVAMTEWQMRADGTIELWQELQRQGEYSVDVLKRVSEAYNAGASAAAAAGVQLDKLTGSFNTIVQGNYISNLADAIGGNANFQTVMGYISTWANTPEENQRNAANYYGVKGMGAISQLGRSDVTLANFFDMFQAELNSGNMDPSTFRMWSNAAGYVNSFNTALQSLVSTLGTEYITTITSVVSQLKSVITDLTDYRSSLLTSDDSPLSIGQKYDTAAAQYRSMYAAAMGGDIKSMQNLKTYAGSFLSASMAANTDPMAYARDFAYVQATVGNVTNYAQEQLDTAELQLDAMLANNQITQAIYDQLIQAFDTSESGLLVSSITTALQNLAGLSASGQLSSVGALYSSQSAAAAAEEAARQQALAAQRAADAANQEAYNQMLQLLLQAMNPYQQVDLSTVSWGGPSYADGGISYGPQLAMVSEGVHKTEAHIPMDDGRSIPVTLTQSTDSDILTELRALRQQNRELETKIAIILEKLLTIEQRRDDDGLQVRVLQDSDTPTVKVKVIT